MLDFRSLYLKEQVTFRGKGRRIKIGIAKDMKARHRQIQTGLPGEWIDLSSQVLFFAHSTEQDLHKEYIDYHTPIKNIKPGSGGSEIFTISTTRLAILRLTLWLMKAADCFIFFTVIGFFIKTSILICYFLLN